VGYVVDKVALGQASSEYFGFPANLHSTNCSTITIIWGWHNRSVVAAVPSGPSLTPLRIIKINDIAGNVACTGEIRNAYRILDRKPERERPLRRLGHRWYVHTCIHSFHRSKVSQNDCRMWNKS
jgi:hypothetical protein